ncbi:RNA exonuclease Ngl1p [[Candida] railenensis]|uniref:RNA exonuclease Ngl1p n=1 Tax=[Candida] railenensis TaxID=45579 RepID=A0A9P0VW18_9ASCO|nr:RNA exonuclease Ngl1p [[Candida] railenensis]
MSLCKKLIKPTVLRRFSSNSISPHTTKSPPIDFDATKYRKWIDLNSSKSSNGTSNNNISVLSYNLLSQHYMWNQVFGYLNEDYLDWYGYRFPLINQSIQQFACDIMCFQELECRVFYEHWAENIIPGKNYESLYLRKPEPTYWGDQPLDCMDGVAIAVNTDRFEILDSQELNYGEFIKEHPDEFDFTEDLQNRVIPRNTVALLVKLLDKETNERIYVTNTHLYWSPKFNDVKVLQTKILLLVLQEFIEPQDLKAPRIIMCGDFNSTPTSNVYKLLETGKLDTTLSEEFLPYNYGSSKFCNQSMVDGIIYNPFNLETAYRPILDDTLEDDYLQFTSYTKSLTAILDHIWYSTKNFEVERILGEVDKKYLDSLEIKGFPNSQFPSDHIPLVTEIGYK